MDCYDYAERVESLNLGRAIYTAPNFTAKEISYQQVSYFLSSHSALPSPRSPRYLSPLLHFFNFLYLLDVIKR